MRSVDDLEIASGTIFGIEPRAAGRRPTAGSVEDALARSLVPALQRPPCFVTFSGGRDSSVILAATLRTAREQGFEDPIPLTLRFPHDPASVEDDHQRLVLQALDVTSREILEPGDDLDVIGPFATDLGVQHGPLVPFNAHFIGYMMRHAAGGSLVTGFGGDEAMTPHPLQSVAAMLTGRTPPRLDALRFYGATRMPERAGRFSRAFRQPWLTPRAIELHNGRLVREVRQWRLHAGRHLWDVAVRSRILRLALDCMERMADGFDTSVIHPFLDDGVVAALARQRGFAGAGSRAELARAAFGDLLPAPALRRTTKASFPRTFWTDTAREGWQALPLGRIDDSLVDVERLVEQWRNPDPIPNTYMLAQHLARMAAQPGPAKLQ